MQLQDHSPLFPMPAPLRPALVPGRWRSRLPAPLPETPLSLTLSKSTSDFTPAWPSCLQAEAKAAFMELLSSVNCSTETSWEQVLKLIVNDGR